MKITQERFARIIGSLLLIFSIAFISVPYLIGGHPGEPGAVEISSQVS
ncbi:MAG: hypothetical protein WC474_00365 [Hydrogenophilaceae bacterium]